MCTSCTYTPLEKMSIHHHTVRDTPRQSEQDFIDNLVRDVEAGCERELASLPEKKTDRTTWQDALRQILRDALMFYDSAEAKQWHRNTFNSTAAGDWEGSEGQKITERLATVRKWCREVGNGLARVERTLADRPHDAWAIRVLLLYLEKVYRKAVPREARGEVIALEESLQAYKMMVSPNQTYAPPGRLHISGVQLKIQYKPTIVVGAAGKLTNCVGAVDSVHSNLADNHHTRTNICSTSGLHPKTKSILTRNSQ